MRRFDIIASSPEIFAEALARTAQKAELNILQELDQGIKWELLIRPMEQRVRDLLQVLLEEIEEEDGAETE